MLIDANLLLYAVISDYPQHELAKPWLEQQLNSPIRIALPWPSLLAFVRIATNPRLFTSPMSVEAAWRQLEEWLALPRTWIPVPMDRHGEILGKLLCETNATGNLVPDAHLAALAMEYGLVLYSSDHDFSRFPGLHWMNPL